MAINCRWSAAWEKTMRTPIRHTEESGALAERPRAAFACMSNVTAIDYMGCLGKDKIIHSKIRTRHTSKLYDHILSTVPVTSSIGIYEDKGQRCTSHCRRCVGY